MCNDTDDLEIVRAHLEIVDLIVQTKNKYDHLLDLYDKPIK